MQNFKYHILNILSALVFSYTTATAINQIIKHNLAPMPVPQLATQVHRSSTPTETPLSWQLVQSNIIDKKVFKEMKADEVAGGTSQITELTLVGTISGPVKIARALIRKQGENEAKIFALYKVSKDIGSDVFGYSLVRIYDTKIVLASGEQKIELNLFEKKQLGQNPPPQEGAENAPSAGSSVKKTISRSEVQQLSAGSVDNATRGLRAGPYRINGQIVGYQLMQVRPYNILYKLGARSGDIIKRVNGKALDSTEKLLQMWSSLKSESQITIDLERGGTQMNFDFRVTD